MRSASVCVWGGGGGVEGRVIGKSVSLPSSPLSLMINSNIFKKRGASDWGRGGKA